MAKQRPDRNNETYPKASAPAYAARLVLGVDIEYALQKLDASVSSRIARAQSVWKSDPKSSHALDPFDKVALVNTYFLAKDKIPKTTAAKIRDYCALYEHKVWKGYGAMNYRLMMDGAGFLAAEEWPEIRDREGLDAAGIRAATKQRLLGYFDGICRQNYSEYGSPIYAAVNLSATRMLAEYARDEDVRKRAEFTLDAMMIDIACTWNQGLNAGPAARAKYWGSTDTGLEAMGSTAAAAWISYGAPRSIAAGGTGWIHSFWMAAPGRYRVPDLFVKVANDRAKPVVYRGAIPAMGKDAIRRLVYHSPGYTLSSQRDSAPSHTSSLYKEARRNMLKWISDKPSSTFAVCMDNPRRPYNLKENRANALGYGENPFSQYYQYGPTLLGLYAVPDDYPYYKLYAPFPTSGSIRKRMEKGGWVFCHNGSMLMAFRSVKPVTWGKKWGGNDMLWCEARRNGWVLETSEVTPFAGGGIDKELDHFAAAVIEKTRLEAGGVDQKVPTLTYTTLAGRKLEMAWQPHKTAYKDHCRVDGKAENFAEWPLHQSRFVDQAIGSPLLTARHGSRWLEMDFSTWTRRFSRPNASLRVPGAQVDGTKDHQ